MMKRLFFWGIAALLMMPANHAAAFSFKKSNEGKSTHAIYIEKPEYHIVFSLTPSVAHTDAQNPSVKWMELSYKYADLEEPPGKRFSGTGGGKIRFLDQDGFALASDVIAVKDLDLGDRYGFIWVEKSRARQIVGADMVPLRAEENLPSPQPSPEVTEKVVPPAPALSLPVLLPADFPRPAITPSPSPSPAPSPSPNIVLSTSPTPSPKASESPKPFERGGADNDGVGKVLIDADKKPPTTVPPSESTIPGLPQSDTAAPPAPNTAPDTTPSVKEDSKNGVTVKQTYE